MSQIAQIPRVKHQLEPHAGLSVSIAAADVVGVVTSSTSAAGRWAAPGAFVGCTAPGRTGRAVAPRAGVGSGRLLGVVRVGPT